MEEAWVYAEDSEVGEVSVAGVAEEVADLEETHLREATKRTEQLLKLSGELYVHERTTSF